MKLVSAPEAVLVDLIWKAELLSLGMNSDTVERQSAKAVAIAQHIEARANPTAS